MRNDPPTGPGRRGLSLIEVLLASTILALFAVTFFNSFLVTTRRTSSSEALLHSGVLAQVVVERIKARSAMNPRFFRDLMGPSSQWSFEGTVVDPSQATNPDSSNRRLSPFFEFLFSRAAPEVCAEANQVAISSSKTPTATGMDPVELDALVEAFRDYEVKVTIKDDTDPGVLPGESPVPGLLKCVVVTVSRISVGSSKGTDPLTFSVTARLSTPGDSLSAESLKGISKRFEGKPLEALWEEVFLTAGGNPYLNNEELSTASRRLLADAYMVLAGANNEALLIEGLPACVPGSTLIDATAESEFIDSWIQKFSSSSAYPLSSSKCELVKLGIRKSAVIFDTFNRVQLPMEHLVNQVLGPSSEGPTVMERAADFMAMLKRIEMKEGGGRSKKGKKRKPRTRTNLKLVKTAFPDYIICSYLYQFFTDPAYSSVISRPTDYADRFRQSLVELRQVLEAHLDQPTGVTPYEKMRSAQIYVEIAKIQQIESNSQGTDPDVQERLRKIALETSPRMGDLAEYLTGGELYDASQLRTRHAEFARRAKELQDLTARYRELVSQFQAGSQISTFLGSYRRFFSELRMDASMMLEQLDSMESMDLVEE